MENMLAQENLMLKKQIQELEEFNTATKLERLIGHLHTQTIDVNLNSTQGNMITADGI